MNNWRSINYTGEYSNQSNFQSKQIIISARECLKFISECKVINIVMEILYTHHHHHHQYHHHHSHTSHSLFTGVDQINDEYLVSGAFVLWAINVARFVLSHLHTILTSSGLDCYQNIQFLSSDLRSFVRRIWSLCWNVIVRLIINKIKNINTIPGMSRLKDWQIQTRSEFWCHNPVINENVLHFLYQTTWVKTKVDFIWISFLTPISSSEGKIYKLRLNYR